MKIKIRDYYKRLSLDNRVQFWNIATSCVVAVITFWVGLSVQYIVYNNGAEESKKLAHHQMVDRIYPTYKKLFEASSPLLGQILRMESDAELETIAKGNTDEIVKIATVSARLMAEYKPYLDARQQRDVSNNNAKILIGLRIIDLSRKQIPETQLIDSVLYYITSGDYVLSATMNTKAQEISRICKELLQSGAAEKLVEEQTCKQMILPALLQNLIIILQELTTPETARWNVVIYCVVALLICLVIGFMIFCFLVHRIFTAGDFAMPLSPEEVRKQTSKLNALEENCSRLKAALYTKDLEIDKLKKTLKGNEEK